MDGLQLLRRQYYALCPAYLLSVPTPSVLASEEGHDTLLSLLDEDPPAPEREYARQFWRRVLPVLEKGIMLGEGVEELTPGRRANLRNRRFPSPNAQAEAELQDVPLRCADDNLARVGRVADQQAGRRKNVSYRPRGAQLTNRTGRCRVRVQLRLHYNQLTHRSAFVGSDREELTFSQGRGKNEADFRTGNGPLHSWVQLVRFVQTDFQCGAERNVGRGCMTTYEADFQLGRGDLNVARGPYNPARGASRRVLRQHRFANLDSFASPGSPPASRRHGIPDNKAQALDWADARGDSRPGVWEEAKGRDIVAADVIYDPDIVPLLVDALSALLEDGRQAILAATVRNEDTFKLFLQRCDAVSLRTELLPLQPMSRENPTFWDTALDLGARVEVVQITRS
ncbi:hypothetical protein A1Q2_05781 [Trichosporon asahii var. asahii CBS 8904]|uniref:Uncharacterized protein n=2 Tax=Trichosporon asahii var. asahii TaxID=189963 RepID=K1V7C4_TRIAC|nr:hypothetical protein A1Q1_05619 [Trichosporon asahii var. asahii CBS 2479]EJT45894.1 hypothetical protein A1Q1_05619 [Trichosporon asahii var. asahii CBS 2479]EKC99904.1 hypothetical protein A1Q2_05781 [Trichosporon asahii var. asahii CBS 8904]